MSRLVVELDRVAELVERMGIFQTHLSRVGTEVEARVRQLHLAWLGVAASTHAEAQARWAAGAAEVQDALAVLRSIALTAHANYAAASLANRRMWAL